MESVLQGEVLIRVGDNISTDAIMPAGAKILPLRSNVPAISEYVFYWIDPDFAKRAKEKHGGFIIGGENYGQGRSEEHTSELQSRQYLVCRLLLEKKNNST